ncbi:MAG TPA: DUF4031 domain-containing protein [Xanthobacteraceae bacterium]|jgi:hypothetical protein|nr:DUF4031 domain-containing protein [Xanthobacteraceae bacterium]
MVVYVDQAMWAWQGLKWCHLLADDLDDLHRFAASLGIKRTSFQAAPKSSVPHYDLTAYERKQAIARGAVPCTRTEIVIIARRLRSKGLSTTQPHSDRGRERSARNSAPLSHCRVRKRAGRASCDQD